MSTEQGDGFGHRWNGDTPREEKGLARAFAGPSQEEFDALADLFLSPDRRQDRLHTADQNRTSANARVRQSERTGTVIEGLIVGHLPVLAGAWIGQYLRHTCGIVGSTAGLVRCTRDHVFVDVAGEARVKNTEVQALSSVLRGIRVDRWMIVAPPAQEMELASMAAEGEIGALTVLTGADEAAVVACYSTIKTLSERAGPSRTGLEIGVVLVGADANRATEIAHRLERATSQFLGRPARLVARIERVSGGGTTRVYGGSDPSGPRELVMLLREGEASVSSVTVPESSAPVRAPEPRHPRDAESRGASEPASPGLASEENPSRASLLARRVKGLEAIDLSCPYASGVEFAHGAGGSLHVLTRDEGGAGVSRLTTAIAWAKAHDELIARGFGLVKAGVTREIIAHLFVDNAAGAKSLLMTDIRVHLLTKSRVDDRVVELCVDLN